MLKDAPTLAIGGFQIAENEPPKVHGSVNFSYKHGFRLTRARRVADCVLELVARVVVLAHLSGTYCAR